VSRLLLGFGLLVAATAVFLPGSAENVCYDAAGFAAVVAVAVGVVRNRPVDRGTWVLFALGLFLFVVGVLGSGGASPVDD
jgi:hypothetical protein